MITDFQARAARGAAKMTMAQLAKASGVSIPTLWKIERGDDVRMSTLRAVRGAFEANGIRFTEKGIEQL